ncbi:translation elongation factor Ts [Bacteroidota bacterium]
MAISAAQVKELRVKTGAGMMDCKKALTEADGDFQKAIEILRKKGASVAAKRAEKTANEGMIITKISDDKKSGIILEVNCETDFVAKSDDFVNFANLVVDAIESNEPKNVEELIALKFDGKNIEEELSAIIGKIGEKIEISRFKIEKAENGILVDYIHHGSKLGVLIKADNVSDKTDEFSELLKDIAMQVAAMNPVCVYRKEVSKETIEKEMEIYKEIARKEGKPEQILEKIATGKLNKYYQENCLSEQAFVKDNAKTVNTLIDEFNKANSTDAKLALFHRFHLSDENK